LLCNIDILPNDSHLHPKLKHVMPAISENVFLLLSVYRKNICRFRKRVCAV